LSLLQGIYQLLDTILVLYRWVLIVAAIFSILMAFNVLDSRNRFVWAVGDFLYRVTEPALRPIRRFLPNLGGVDLSPLVLILVIDFLIRPALFELFRLVWANL
jgi:YggT family protein